MIVIDNLVKKFDSITAINIENLSVHRNDIYGMIGNNGAGKTTLLKLIVDLLKPDRGNVFIKNVSVMQSEHWKCYTRSFIDNNSLIDFLKPLEYLEFIGFIHGIKKNEIRFRLKKYEALSNFDLYDNKLIRMLSLGNKQKVGIIGALITLPELLILDEPFNFLDPTAQFLLKDLLIEMNKKQGTTMVISSHNLKNIVEISSRIGLIENGQINKEFISDETKISDIESYFVPQ